jgi:phosphoribosylamine--glycine ligase
MNILIIGSGGREHALAWKLAQSPRVERIFVSPGNGGTDGGMQIANSKWQNVADVQSAICNLQSAIGLVVIGPEAPLAAGIVDDLQAAGVRCFGPIRAAARLESSKAFAKEFMARYGIPTARAATFSAYDDALTYLRRVDTPIVIKASGLAAGKGVILPQTPAEAEAALRQIIVERQFGAAGDEVLIEERLSGPEVSLLAFCDGRTVVPMPPAQDHKRVFDNDRGPNTGGMGAYAPAPIAPPALVEELVATVLQPTVDGMAAEGTPYIGVLYAGLMLTPAGPRVLEFNCRFGDPETQVILPLLETDLLEVLEACVDGTLDRVAVRWRDGAAATVVAASEGYPGSYPKNREIMGVETAAALPGVTVFHAGTRWLADTGAERGEAQPPFDPLRARGQLLTDGGRVLAVTGVGADLRDALGRAYAGMRCIHFAGMHYRRDIGANA